MTDHIGMLVSRFQRSATVPLVIRSDDTGLRIYRGDSTYALATFGVGFTAVRDDKGDVSVYAGAAPQPVSTEAPHRSSEPLSELQRLQRAHLEGRHG
jgi:hypothetical protein